MFAKALLELCLIFRVKQKMEESHNSILKWDSRDIQLFSKTISVVLNGKSTPKIDFPIYIFRIEFQTYLLTYEMEYVISLEELTMNCICFYI